MENKILALITVVSLLALPAATQADGKYYFGGGIGTSQLKIDSGNFNNTSKSERDIGYQIVGGYKFSRYLSIEGGYIGLGEAKNKYDISGNEATLNAKAHSLFLAGKATLPLNEEISVFGKLGVSATKSTATISDPALTIKADGSKTKPMVGLGFQYDFGRTWNWSATVEYDFFGKTADDLKAGLISLNLLYSFN